MANNREKTVILLAYTHQGQDFKIPLDLKSATHVRRLTDTLLWACRSDLDVIITPNHETGLTNPNRVEMFASTSKTANS